jgi:hypothetical protein
MKLSSYSIPHAIICQVKGSQYASRGPSRQEEKTGRLSLVIFNLPVVKQLE